MTTRDVPAPALRSTATRSAVTMLATSGVGRLPQAMSALAIVQLVLSADGAYSLAATLTAVYVLAGTVGAPALGRAVDRLGRPRPVLLSASLVSAASLLWLSTAVQAPAVAVLAALVAGFSSPPLEPTLRGFWPRLFPEPERLHRAYSADAAVQEVLFIVGPLLAVASVSLFGAPGAVVVMAGFVVVGTGSFCLHRMPSRRPHEVGAADAPRARVSPLRVEAIRVLVVAQVGAGLPIGVLTITAAAHASLTGSHAGSAAGWGLAVNAAGALCGALLVARFPLRLDPGAAVRLLMVFLGVLYLPTAFVGWSTPLWLVTAFVSGLCLPPLLTQVFAVTGRVASERTATEANAWVVSAFSVGIAAGTLGAGVAVQEWSADGVLVAVAVASALTVLAAVHAAPRRLGCGAG